MANKILENISSLYTDKSINGWIRGAVWAGTILVVYIAGRGVYKKIFPSQLEKNVKKITDDIKNLEEQGQKPSYPNSQYGLFANSIYESMRYCVGDDYSTVVNIMKKMNNNIDVAKLVQAYDIRQLYCFGIASGMPKDLFTAINAELGNEYLGVTAYRVRDINKNWKAKGITYQI